MFVYTSPNRQHTMEVKQIKIVVGLRPAYTTPQGKVIRAKRTIDIIVKRPNGDITSVFYQFNKDVLGKYVRAFKPAIKDFTDISYPGDRWYGMAESDYIEV